MPKLSAAFSGFVLSLLLSSCGSLSVTAEPGTSVTSPVTAPLQTPQIPQSLPISAQIVINKTIIGLEVAQTNQEQMIGLMMRRTMPADRGMLFPFNPPQPASFWMKNTLIPLDMLFLRQGVIQNIQTNVPPCSADPCPSYGPTREVLIDQVIELNAGRAATLGLKVGDKLVVQPLAVGTRRAIDSSQPTP